MLPGFRIKKFIEKVYINRISTLISQRQIGRCYDTLDISDKRAIAPLELCIRNLPGCECEQNRRNLLLCLHYNPVRNSHDDVEYDVVYYGLKVHTWANLAMYPRTVSPAQTVSWTQLSKALPNESRIYIVIAARIGKHVAVSIPPLRSGSSLAKTNCPASTQ